MIALPVISQANYISNNIPPAVFMNNHMYKINEDTLVCYTRYENRNIAILLKEREELNENTIISDSIELTQKEQIFTYYNLTEYYKNQTRQYKADNDTLNTELVKTTNKNKSLKQQVKIYQIGTVSLSILSILLILL